MAALRPRHALWLDIRRSIRHSLGRFLSIVGLMALGSFALVGLFVTGPDMRATGRAYFDALDAADIMVIGDFGLNGEDRALIEQTGGIDAATGSASAASRAQVVGTSSSWDGSLSWEPQVQLITSNDSDANGYSFQRYELPEPAQGGN